MKKVTLWFMVFLLLVIVIGCSTDTNSNENGENGNTNGENENANGVEEATVTFSYWGSDFDQARMEAIRDKFYEEHSHIEVELVHLPGGEDYVQQQLTRMASGDPYDVVQFAEESYQFAARGTLADLTPYVERDGIDLGQYYETAVDAYTHNGTLYGMPLRTGTNVLYYNKTLFDENGLDYPDETWTWEDAIGAAEAIRDGEKGIFGFDRVGDWWASYDMFLRSFEGGVLTEDRTAYHLDSAESAEGLQLMQDLIWDLDVAPDQTQVAEGVDMWTSGLIGMKLDGPWHVLSSQENITDFEWDIAPVPEGTVRATPTFNTAFHMAETSENKDAAWEVIKFWTGQEAQEILASEHGDVPTMIDVAESDTYLDLGGEAPENFHVMADSMDAAFEPQITLVWSEIEDMVGEGMMRMLELQEPIDEVVEELQHEIESLLAEAEEMEQMFEEG